MNMNQTFKKTLYEQHSEVFETFRDKWPYIYLATTICYDIKQLDAIVGSKRGGASYHWLKGKPASLRSERNARLYFENLNHPPVQPKLNLQLVPKGAPAPEPEPEPEPVAVVAKPEPLTFMVDVPAEYMEKWQALVDIIQKRGCKVAAF